MLKTYDSKPANIAIIVGSLAVFAVALWLVGSQETLSDVAYMKVMIPHHSIAINDKRARPHSRSARSPTRDGARPTTAAPADLQ